MLRRWGVSEVGAPGRSCSWEEGPRAKAAKPVCRPGSGAVNGSASAPPSPQIPALPPNSKEGRTSRARGLCLFPLSIAISAVLLLASVHIWNIFTCSGVFLASRRHATVARFSDKLTGAILPHLIYSLEPTL